MFERHQYSSSNTGLGMGKFIFVSKPQIRSLIVQKKNVDCTWNLRTSIISRTSPDDITPLLKNLLPIFCGVWTDQLQKLSWLAEIICKKPWKFLLILLHYFKIILLIKHPVFIFKINFPEFLGIECERNSNTDKQSKSPFLLYQTSHLAFLTIGQDLALVSLALIVHHFFDSLLHSTSHWRKVTLTPYFCTGSYFRMYFE